MAGLTRRGARGRPAEEQEQPDHSAAIICPCGDPSWLLAPVCLLLMIALGIDAAIQTRQGAGRR